MCIDSHKTTLSKYFDVISDRGSGSEKGVLPDSKKASDQGLKLESGFVKIKYERV